MIYLALNDFKDKTDNNRLFNKGDVYRCENQQRIDELKEKGYLTLVHEKMTKKDIISTLSDVNIIVEDDKTKNEILDSLK
ncbi:hypothetical protein [Staphylococcus aureus]|uniref:Uncharacterized protein n=1 Tax=Staphylococcus aureus TaxID=1280 RepID=A0A517JRB5_STAAU|nr:hypothetical protein [Staphylococcus aureus]NDP69455.1 hypothetical protein [Staphylococcus aureus]NDP74261.1 hypothetical protein [Staphylococcus aureus]NDR07333.1 hypothetical protein [Staphylococcus aureus]QDS42723.1 hypothetical protein FP479_14205 [Staphylococcus aureus]QDS47466.1 hypothetical protein FP477_10280 [Staphylococcus aureus]